MKISLSFVLPVSLLWASLGIGSIALADADFPQHTVKIVVPVPPGPIADLLPRIVATKLSETWGKPVIVENRPGAALNLAATLVSRAVPDGHTLLATPAPPLSINQSLYPKLEFDPLAFVPVTVIAQSPNVLLVNPKVPVSNLGELIMYAKANPGKLTYASSGNGSTPHLTMELLRSLAGIDMVHAPYKASAPALKDLLGGHVDLMFDNLGNAAGPIREGRLKGLGIGSEQRNDALPDVPALAETYPGFRSVAWFAMVAPPKTPPAIVAKLSSPIVQIIRQPDVAQKFIAMFATPVASTPEQTAAFIADERARWHKVIVAANIKTK